MKKITWHITNILFPLSESARIIRAMKYSGSKLAEQARRLKKEKKAVSGEICTFDEVVSVSGMSHDMLIRRYLSIKRAWLLLFSITFLFIMLLPLAVLLTEGPVSDGLILRLISMVFMLSGFAGLMFARMLKSQYHLWQLQTRRLGTFAEWKATGHPLRDIFSWWLC